MKQLTGLLFVSWLIAACSQANTTPTDSPIPVEQTEQEAVAVLPEPTKMPVLVSPTTPPEPPAPTEAIKLELPTTVVEPTVTVEPLNIEPSTEPETEPAPDQSLQVNGSYEGTYFRGSADAPVTLVDFSDFL